MFNSASQHVQRPQCPSQGIRQSWLSCRMHLHTKVPFSWGVLAQGDADTVVGSPGPAGTGRRDGGRRAAALSALGQWWLGPEPVLRSLNRPGVPTATATRLLLCPCHMPATACPQGCPQGCPLPAGDRAQSHLPTGAAPPLGSPLMWPPKDVVTIKVRCREVRRELGFPVSTSAPSPAPPSARSQRAPLTAASIYSYLLKQHRVCELPLGQK